ncbi:MAG: G-D-S-L family lipolytic protein [Desmonostoc vinosum HA7617-LM4]|jgi:lysophospholipase L1-like esterase|nr:G-D-S-L family lipolytic protein [Desmonostoc vinosum HA7617-LM4]
MRYHYLLAAGLLTGLAIPASALPQLSIILPENSRYLWNSRRDSQPPISQKIVPRFNIFFPKLSSQAVQPSEGSQPKPDPKNVPSADTTSPQYSHQGAPELTESSLNPSTQPVNLPLISGYQLYYQRLAALKTGQSYTRTDGEAQSLTESAKKPQLTYEDWKSLLALEAKAITQGQGKNHLSILVGDSLSMWFPREKLPAGKLWLNQGISGDTSNGVFKRLGAFSATRPDAIYVMAGINDIRKGASDQAIARNHRRILRNLRQTHPKAQIILQSILPTRLPTISNSRIRHLNTQLALIAKQEGANYLNIHNWFIDFQGNLRLELTTDGLHLSQEGYDVWLSAIEQIERNLAQQTPSG